MNAYYEVLRILKTSLEENKHINTVTQGNILEMDLDKHSIYPLGHIEVSTGTFQENVIQFDCTIYAMDIKDISKEIVTDKFVGNDNEIDALNTMLAVVRRTYLELAKDMRTQDITIIGEPNIDLAESNANMSVGWRMNFQIEVPDTIISTCI